MSCGEKMNNALDYIEANLTGWIDLNQAARRTGYSLGHFLRVFSFVAEIPLSEYIRRRRLTLAAFDLLEYNSKIIDIAAKYGYDSPAAFSRAFKGMHGSAPTDIRNTGTLIKSYPRLSFHVTLDGGANINYRIMHKEAHEVCGIMTDIPVSSERTNDIITGFWEDNIKRGALGQFHRDIGLEYSIPLNAGLFNRRHDMFSYMICYESPRGGTPAGYSTLTVPQHTWVVFSTQEHYPRDTTVLVRRLRERIFLEWFPTSAYARANAPEFEIFKSEKDKNVVDIWIPIEKRLL